MAMVGQNSSKRSCDGRYYLFYRWLNPIPVSVFVQGKPTWCRRLFPVRSPVRSHPFVVVAAAPIAGRRSPAADN